MEPSQIDMMEEKELRMELNKAVVEIIAIKQEEWKTRKSFLITEDSLNTANEIIDENINEISTLKQKIEELENPWVGCEDEFPEVGDEILGYGIWEDNEVIEPVIEVGFRSELDNPKKPKEWCDFSFPVTHWMPLPSPPISQKQGE